MEYDVSIIIPVYNNERSIARCLESILNQKTSYSFEVICVSDPCKDNTLGIINSFIEKNSNIKNIDVTTRSVGFARLRGIKEAKGEYLMFIDGDDYYREDAIETMVSKMKETNADIVTSSYYYVRNGKAKKNFFSKNKTYDRKGMLKALMQDSFMHGFMWNKIYKTELLQGKSFILPPENIIREDVLTNFQIFMNCSKLVLISKPIYYYDKTYESTTSAKDITRIPWFIKIFATERFLIEKKEPTLLKMYLNLNARRHLLIWGDRQIIKSGYTKEEYKKLKVECKNSLKILKKKGTLELNGVPWEKFIKDYFINE